MRRHAHVSGESWDVPPRVHMSGVVIVGGSVAGLTLARELRAQGYARAITIIDEDPAAGYRRPALSKGVLDGSVHPSRISLNFPEDLAITRIHPARAWWPDVGHNVVEVTRPGSRGSMTSLAFDWLVVASGMQARSLPVPAAAGALVTLRSLADAIALRDSLQAAQDVVIIGAGFLGLEIAASACALGSRVTVLEEAARPLARAVDPVLGQRIAELHERHGVRIACDTRVAGVGGGPGDRAVVCDDGRIENADLVIAAVGSTFDAAWLPGVGLSLSSVAASSTPSPSSTAQALQCDGYGRCLDSSGHVLTSVLAIGDASAWWHPLFGQRLHVEHWTHAIEQARHAASVIMGTATAPLACAPYFWSEQFDARIQSVGWLAGHDEVRVLQENGDCLLVAYGSSGTLTCVAAIGYGPLLQDFRSLVEARVPFADVSALSRA